jgi:AAA domain-containing protein
VIEAKGGDVVLVNGNYFRRQPNGRLDSLGNPFEQAEACKRHLSDFLAEHVEGLGGGPRVGRAVAFPHVRVNKSLGPQGPREIILDAGDLQHIQRSIGQLVDYWKPQQRLTDSQLARIRKLLVPSVTVSRLLRDELADASAALVELTSEQYEVLDAIGGNRQALVLGGAGTGKTLLALERTRRLADLGASVLLVCFNQLLGEKLAAEFSGNALVTAGTFHQVARRLAVRANRLIPANPSQEWWDRELPTLFPEVAAETGFEVDAVVVDEGQDFRSNWWDALRLVLHDVDDGWFYVFADAHQALFVPGWCSPFASGGFEYRLTKNCRNTRPVAARVAAVFGGEVKTNKVEGPKPKFHVVGSVDAAVERVLDRLGELLAEGVEPKQIQVLSTTWDVVARLRGRDVDGIGLVAHGEDGIAVETVQRYKGLESEVVILVVPELLDELDRSLAYTGLSRAQTFLEVVGPAAVMDAIGWGAG